MKPHLHAALAAAAAAVAFLTATGCSEISPEARHLAGSYYIPEVSRDVPLIDLYTDGTCILRAVKPGVLTYAVPGKWDVRSDSLLCELRPDRLTFDGDSTLIGKVARRISSHISAYNGLTLTLEKEGVKYLYHRRGE